MPQQKQSKTTQWNERTREAPGVAIPRVSSRDLLRAGQELIIEHAGRDYRLRITASGKLILTA